MRQRQIALTRPSRPTRFSNTPATKVSHSHFAPPTRPLLGNARGPFHAKQKGGQSTTPARKAIPANGCPWGQFGLRPGCHHWFGPSIDVLEPAFSLPAWRLLTPHRSYLFWSYSLCRPQMPQLEVQASQPKPSTPNPILQPGTAFAWFWQVLKF